MVVLAADVVQCLAPHAMMLPREGWEGQRHDQTPAALLIARYVELGGSEAVYLDRLETPDMRHWTAHHLVAPDRRLAVDPLGRPVVSGAPPQWPHTWDMAVRTMRMAPRGQRAGWPGAERLLAEARAAQVQQPAGNTKDCGVCALMSAVGTLLRVPRPGNLLSALDRRWVAAVVLNRDMGPIARLPSLGELPAAVLEALPAPRTPLDLANVPHNVGLPGARRQHALLCMAAVADGGMSMLATVSLQHVQDAMQQQRMHAPQPWEESAKRWLRVESVSSTHTLGMADMGRLVVLEGAEYWTCVRVETGGLEWVVVTACRLRRQQSRGPACYRVFQECLSGLGPVRRAHRCTAEDIPPAPAVFVEVTRPPVVQGQDVWPVAPSNMWQAEHAAGICRALQGHAAALPRAPAAQSSSNRPAASLALLQGASRAWYWVVAALEPHSSALRLYDRGQGTVLTVRPADLEALHLSALSGDGGDALYLQGTVAGAAEMPSAWLWRRTWGRGSGRSPFPGGGSRATGRSSPTRGAAGWRSSFPRGECCTCRNHQACHQYGQRHPRPRRRGRPRKRRPSRRPRGAPRLSMAPMPTFGTCCSTSVVTWPRISVGQRRSMSAPGLGWMGLVTALGKLASSAGPPNPTPRTCWTTSSETMRLIRRNGTRRWPC